MNESEVERLTRLVGGLEREMAGLRVELAGANSLLAERDVRIGELERLLEESRRAGKRQSAPFSKGDPKERPARPGRKSGESHGRHGHRRVPEKVDRELDAAAAEVCPHCGGRCELVEVAAQYQTDLPAPVPVTTKFCVEIRRCVGCGARVQGRHGEQTSDALGAAGSQVGPQLKALAALLHYQMGLSFGRVAQLMSRWGVPVTAGAICQSSQATGAALVPTTTAIKAALAAADQVTMDETGWRISGRKAWLWVATSKEVTLFDVAEGRGFDEACGLLDGGYDGVLVRDGWAPYRKYTEAAHQTCLAHILRRCHEMRTDGPESARGTPTAVADVLHDALDARGLSALKRKAKAAEFGERIDGLIAQPQEHDANRKLLKHLAIERNALFTFLEHPGVDATNWRGEQGIRPGVVNRKTSGGNRSDRGAATQGRIMSVLRTAHQQSTDAIALLVGLARAPTPVVVPLNYPGTRFNPTRP